MWLKSLRAVQVVVGLCASVSGGCAVMETGSVGASDRAGSGSVWSDAGLGEMSGAVESGGERGLGEEPTATQEVTTAGGTAGMAMAPPPDEAMAPVPIQCAAGTVLAGSEQTVTLMHDGMQRSYELHVGAAVATDEPSSLIVNFHGFNNDPGLQMAFSGMNEKADEAGFVVAYPRGVGNSFNAGGCCGSAASDQLDDVGFSLAIVQDVTSKLCIEPARVYATGFSNGGFMSHRLACEHSEVFAAVAPVGGRLDVSACAPSRPVSIFGVHNTGDPIVAYDDGLAAIDKWVGLLGCNPVPTTEVVPGSEAFGGNDCQTWNGCEAGSEVRFCTWRGGFGHLWPTAAEFPATDQIWEFFERHPLH